ncbi:hypothetical protein Bbelb_334640 [Branchiostoma belcheri]|nr:hypothetical protein Bbelb_334640 [Branchiostoma belcheri]
MPPVEGDPKKPLFVVVMIFRGQKKVVDTCVEVQEEENFAKLYSRCIDDQNNDCVQKAKRRTRALERSLESRAFSDRTKKRAESQSSESSGEDEGNPVFSVRRLPWESSRLRKLKDALDKVCPQKGVPRVQSEEWSSCEMPEGTPAWARKRRQDGF